ncbi:hypothetical protein Z043_124644 [Scleropages formosus]|uniref:Uncharacterized protein n=1 Tax=Scleropages formosus TaxID=113540 RepID=A0A0P7XXF5_SCLFO|nr:hypothetical protein Z043_124644 [Scleropages formosus]
MNIPYAHCKGILYGTMTLELGGQVTIVCEKTGYSAQLEFKLKPFLGSNDSVNQISGKIKLGKEVLATLEGHWDSEIFVNDKKTGVVDMFWNPTPELRQSRLTRCTVPPEEQGDFESERLWQHVTRAINNKDQTEATKEKFLLEEVQRKCARERKAKLPLVKSDISWMSEVAASKRKHKHKGTERRCSSPECDRHDSSGSETGLGFKSHWGCLVMGCCPVLGVSPYAMCCRLRPRDPVWDKRFSQSIASLRNRAGAEQVQPEASLLHQRDYVVVIFLIFAQIVINFLFK